MKSERQKRILELIRDNDIERQEELAELLRKEGLVATQATVSRDIRELKLKKLPAPGKRSFYRALPNEDVLPEEKYIRILKEAYVSMDTAVNILVIKTVSGMAMAAAAALDACRLSQIVGCIAGDDTIMCAIRSVPETAEVKDKIEQLLSLE